MTKFWMILALLTALLGTSSCASMSGLRASSGIEDGRYDFSSVLLHDGLDRFSNSFPMINASGKPVFVTSTGDKTVGSEEKLQGHAVVIPPYVLTAAHVVDLRRVFLPVRTPFGVSGKRVYANDVVEDMYWLSVQDSSERIPLEKIRIEPKGDWALFKLPEGFSFWYEPIALGRSGELRVGHTVYLIGSPRMRSINVREGIISSLKQNLSPQLVEEYLELYGHLYGSDRTFSVSIAAIAGDSGARVVALRDGVPEIVGILVAEQFGVMGLVMPIDIILEEIKSSTGIDLRKQNEENIKRSR